MVVVIVVVVAVLLIPAIASIRHTAVRSQCQNNLRVIGTATASYSISHNFSLPPYFGDSSILFDTLAMRSDTGAAVNLGALLSETESPTSFYCPSQDADTSPCLAYNSPENRWQMASSTSAPAASRGASGASAPAQTGLWQNSSYAARFRKSADAQIPSWTLLNHNNKVIYSDFIGVDDWAGRGRFTSRIRAAHSSAGYNRLFGDGVVLWTPSSQLDELRPITAVEPTADELARYWLLNDVLR
ncbi:MAG: DUF1559 domain-containing protein [Planctomycetaceae bacterium]|nr:DUF1559 domain-containing protein [Planctomycetaceae bacterium]